MKLDGYSGFRFFQALAPQDIASGGAAVTGVDFDPRVEMVSNRLKNLFT